MKATTKQILLHLIERHPELAPKEAAIEAAYHTLYSSLASGHRLYLCGNGGSAADCEHMAGELLKCFKKARPLPMDEQTVLSSYGEMGEKLATTLEDGLPVVSLCGHPAFSTAYQNDNAPELVFAQQVHVYGQQDDVLVVFSTSGNSKNCIYACIAAKARGMKIVLLTGGEGGKLKAYADVAIIVPEKETYLVQELHLPVYHCLCAMLEEEFF